MAFRSNGPVTLALPAFRGVTRQIILTILVAFFARLVLEVVIPGTAAVLVNFLLLHSEATLWRMPWQLLTYPLVGSGLIGTLFAVLSIWFFGSALEEERGGRWLIEYLLTATVVGGLLACMASWLLAVRIPGLRGDQVSASLWPAALALLLAYARFHAEQQLSFNFILRIRAKYLAALYLLFYLALALIGGDRFGALLALANGLAGFLFLKLVPASGMRMSLGERWYGLRNALLRSRRRRAGKKFAVYMKKQGRDVNIDSDGHYIAPEDAKQIDTSSGHKQDRRWMN